MPRLRIEDVSVPNIVALEAVPGRVCIRLGVKVGKALLVCEKVLTLWSDLAGV